jgi:glycosyltransferase involved in cell wall biosynthesis
MSDRRPLRFAVVLQTPKDPQSAVYLGYQTLGMELERLGHSVEIVSPADFSAVRRMKGRWVPFAYPFAIASWMHRRRRDFDLVMFHSYAGWLATALGHGRRTRSFVMFHGVEPLYHRELREEATADGHPLSWRYRLLQEGLMPFMLRIACRTADGVSCLNRAEEDFLAARKWAPAGGVRTLAHGVSPEFFAPPRAPQPVRTLLFVGQWLPMKGTQYLRDAAVSLLREDSSMCLICAGTLVLEDTVLSDFPQDLRRQITVLPRVDQTALARLYHDADVFVFPSLYEGFSRAIVEAMASRLPIITTAVGVAADALRHEESALFVPKRSAAAIVVAVRRLKADPAFAAQIGEAAGVVAEGYRLDIMQRRTIDIIMEVAGAAR